MSDARDQYIICVLVVNLVSVGHFPEEFLCNFTTFVDGGAVVAPERVDDFGCDGESLLFFPAAKFTGTVCDDPVVPEKVPRGHVGGHDVSRAESKVAIWIWGLNNIPLGTPKHAIHGCFNVKCLRQLQEDVEEVSGYMRRVGLVSPFRWENVFNTSVTSASTGEALHWDSASGPYHSLTLAIPVEFNTFLTPINATSNKRKEAPCRGSCGGF